MQITTVGLDLTKSWFQVHGVDADGKVAVRRKLKRSDVISFFKSLPSCLVRASLLDKHQAIEIVTKIRYLGMRYWAHFRAERLDGSEFYCVRAGIRRQFIRTGMAEE